MLDIVHLSIRGGSFRVQDVSFQVAPGGVHVLLGPTGTGKTLLLEAIAGLRPVERGRVFLAGRDCTAAPAEKRGLAYVPQDLALFPHLSVRDNILFPSRVQGRLDHAARKHADWLMEVLGIGDLADREPRFLSGGERQRVALARGLATGARLLLLDEPFAALNESLRRELWMMLKHLQRSLDLAILMVTHDLEEAFFLADRISVLIDGVIEQTDAKDHLFHRPRTVPVARYLGIRNLFDGEVVGHPDGVIAVRCQGLGRTLQVAWEEQEPPPAPGTAVVLGIRSEEVKLVHPEFEQTEPINPFQGRVEALYAKGASHTLVLRSAEVPGQTVELEVGNRVMRKLHLAPGVECTVDLKPSLLNLLPAPNQQGTERGASAVAGLSANHEFRQGRLSRTPGLPFA